MIEAKPRLDIGRNKRVDQAILKSQSGFVRGAAAGWHDPRPRDGKAVGIDTEIAHEADVFGIAMVVVAGDVTGIAVCDSSALPTLHIPDARPTTVLVGGAFDLIARR
jgi:hypothetical protein